MSDTPLLVVVDGSIATLTLNRPEAKNAIDAPMRTALRDAIHTLRQDRSVRVLVLRGAGNAFCSGGDIRGMAVTTAEEGRTRLDDLHDWVAGLIELDRPVIATVDGVAFGAGFSLALAADFVIATTRARFCMPFLKVGLVPDFGAFFTLPRAVGMARAKDLVFTAREIGAEEAQRFGLVSEVVPPERLDERGAAVAAAMAGAPQTAFGLAKRALNMSLGSDLRTLLELESSMQGIAYSTDFHRQAVKRFRDKAEPLYSWPLPQ
jgi:2-(1,2-epoxy-1,2-dihydrophenyl)acetyl-CoA isomerase